MTNRKERYTIGNQAAIDGRDDIWMGEISVGELCDNWMPRHVRRIRTAADSPRVFPPVKGLNACKCPASWLVWSHHRSAPRRNATTFSPSNATTSRLCVPRAFWSTRDPSPPSLPRPDDYSLEIECVITASKWMKLLGDLSDGSSFGSNVGTITFAKSKRRDQRFSNLKLDCYPRNRSQRIVRYIIYVSFFQSKRDRTFFPGRRN